MKLYYGDDFKKSIDVEQGDMCLNDLDGLEYMITKIIPRDECEPLPGVKQLGNCVYLRSNEGRETVVYDWEISPILRKSV